MIIGQKKLMRELDELVANNSVAQFSIITGIVGSGKKLMAEYLANALKAENIIVIQPKMESIQEMITTAKSTSGRTAFLIFDADLMSIQAKNATLKIFEEPPKDTYFIMTASDLGNVLTTVISRAHLIHIDTYSAIEIVEYAKYKDSTITDEVLKLVTSICEVPGEVDTLLSMNPTEFYAFVDKVINSIATVPGANAFKIADKLNLKDETDKYDTRLFLKAFTVRCLDKSSEDFLKYLNAVTLTADYLVMLLDSKANKQMIIDNWILAIRKEWLA